MIESLKKIITNPFIIKLFITLISIILIFIVSRVLINIIAGRLKENNSRYRFKKIFSISKYMVIILVISIIFSENLGGLTVALGVAGAGIAFALQEVIVSIAGWFAITFGHFYNPGDRVKLGGIKGDIIDITLLRTTIMEMGDWINGDLYNGRVVRIANSFVFKEPVYNYSGDFPFLWDELTIPVRYGSDIEFTKMLFQKITESVVGEYSQTVKDAWISLVKKYLIEDAKIKPLVTINADENWITFTIRYVVNYKNRRSTKDLLFDKILKNLDRYRDKISIASAAQEVTILQTPEQ